MFRKLLVVAAAIAMSVSLVAVSGGIAGANTSGVAAKDSIICHDITGTIHFNRPLNNTGYTSGTIVTTVSATLTHCTAAGPYAVTVTQGKTTGTLTSAAGTHAKPVGKCAALVGSASETGSLSTAWTANHTVPASVIHVKSDTGGTHSGHGSFKIPGSVANSPSPTGSFGGTTETGSADTTLAQTTLTIAAITTACSHGVSSLALETDSAGPAVSLNS